MTAISFDILGPLRVRHDESEVALGGTKERCLLAVLLLEQGRVVSLDRLIEEVWPANPPQQPVSSLRVLASRLRRALAAVGCQDRIRTVPPGYLIAVEPGELDAQRFAAQAAEGAALLEAGRAEEAATVLGEALGLWRGDVLADITFGPASVPATRRLDEERLVALEHRIEADVRCGRHEQVCADLETLVRSHPLRETLWHKLVLCHVRCGRQADALRQAETFVEVLAELGLEPSPAFAELVAAVRAGDPALEWRPDGAVRLAPVARGPSGPLPRPLVEARSQALFGRRGEMARLLSIFDGVAEGTSATALVTGEPGVGKTSLTAEFAALAQARAGAVLYGRCDEDLQIPYQPFREALQEHLSTLERVQVQQVLGRWPRLARLAGPYADLAEPRVQPGADAEADRILLFETVEGWLRDMASAGPVVLVVEDLHWATAPTVQLFRFLSHQKWWPLLSVATFRDTDSGDSGLREMLAGIHRAPNIHRISLHGLDREGVTLVLESRAGRVLDESDLRLAGRIHDETGGNPFFTTQLVRHVLDSGLDEIGDGDGVAFQLPDGVRDVIRQRLERLSPEANRVLRVAATIGPTSPFVLLATVLLGGEASGLLDALDEATSARLLMETNDADYVFVHALVRKTIYASLSGARRRQLHRAVAEGLLQLPTPLGEHNAALAHHFCLGAGPGDGAQAARYALVVGCEALDQVAPEMAIDQFRRGLEVLARYGPADEELEADLYLGLAEAFNRINDFHGRGDAAWEAARLARRNGLGDRLAAAAFWMARFGIVGSSDPRAMALCEEALDALGPAPSPMKARVLAVLASARALSGEGIEADPLAAEAVAIARTCGDQIALGEALDARFTTLSGGPDVGRRMAVAEEMVTIAEKCSDFTALGNGHRFRGCARLIRGDRRGFDEDFDAMNSLAAKLRDGFLTAIAAQWRATVALLDGRFVEVEDYAGEAVELSRQDPNFVNAWAAQLLWLRHEQGRLEEFLPLVRDRVEENPAIVGFRSALAMAYATAGIHDEARHHLVEIVAGRPLPIPNDWIRTASLTLCAEAAAVIGEREVAAWLEEALEPYGGQLVLVATGTHCPGAVDRFLGMLAMLREDYDSAEARLRSALILEEGVRSAPNAARTRLWYARLIKARGGPIDVARELATESAMTAERLGMAAVLADALALLDDLPDDVMSFSSS